MPTNVGVGLRCCKFIIDRSVMTTRSARLGAIWLLAGKNRNHSLLFTPDCDFFQEIGERFSATSVR